MNPLSRPTALVASLSPRAQEAKAKFETLYEFSPLEEAEVLIVLGGDGFMLETLHSDVIKGKEIYGMNLGTVGFLLNPLNFEDLDAQINAAEITLLNPLRVKTEMADGTTVEALAFNDVSVLRSGTQSAHLEITVDGFKRVEHLVGDGALVATAAGSSAYNASAGGPIIPLGSEILALTPICTSSHRQWKGALLDGASVVEIRNIDPVKRPVVVDADSARFENIKQVTVSKEVSSAARLLFKQGHALEDRLMALQFS